MTKLNTHLKRLLEMYKDVQFYRVADVDAPGYPDELDWFANWQQITYREYYSLAGLGAIAR